MGGGGILLKITKGNPRKMKMGDAGGPRKMKIGERWGSKKVEDTSPRLFLIKLPFLNAFFIPLHDIFSLSM